MLSASRVNPIIQCSAIWAGVLFLAGLVACGGGTRSSAGGPDSGNPTTDGGADGEMSTVDGGADSNVADSAVGAACVAAGGQCIGAGSICPGPTDPSLVDTCGDPNQFVCCAAMPEPMDAYAPSPDARDADDEDALPPPQDANGDIVWMGPPPPPGAAGCMVENPQYGGGCVCEEQNNGHLYGLTCENDTSPCTCTVDGAPTKQIANVCESTPSAFYQQCGFP